jgi:osmotically-inducible protein OsmY
MRTVKSDMQLQRDVSEELKWDPAVNAAQIRVEVKDGAVTLVGRVEYFAEKWAAEWAAKRVSGVKELAVEIEVKPIRFRKLRDADIARAAENTLKWHAYVPQDRIKVTVEDGWITLEGEVEKQFEKETARQVVLHLAGVKGVSNQIVLKPKVEPIEVKDKIEAAFKRSAILDLTRIAVKADGGKVILNGTVRSWTEYVDAERAAWAAPGVHEIKNLLRIVD